MSILKVDSWTGDTIFQTPMAAAAAQPGNPHDQSDSEQAAPQAQEQRLTRVSKRWWKMVCC